MSCTFNVYYIHAGELLSINNNHWFILQNTRFTKKYIKVKNIKLRKLKTVEVQIHGCSML